MNNSLNRRTFIKQAALAASAITVFPNIIRAKALRDANNTLNCVQIGCGGRSMDRNAHFEVVINQNAQNLYAIVDPDEKRHAAVMAWIKKKNLDAKPQFFTDYRQMYDKVGKNIDAVFITTPNHHHATAAMLAMEHGVNVYCEKPLCHDIGEARRLRKMAAKSKVATQMGNQGHCMEGYISLCEYIWSGAIGKVTETHSWTNRSNGGVGPRPPKEPVPAGMDWDSWIGPAPYRDFHADLHPHEWHGWYDFGNGSIGNMACHVLDGMFWSLKVDHPTTIEVEQMRGGSDERYPTGCRLRWDIPARADMPPVKAYWYEGLNPTSNASADGRLHAATGDARYYPALVDELMKKYPDEDYKNTDSGTLYVGDKGIIYTGTYGDRMHIVPIEKMSEVPKPPKTLPRPQNVFLDFITACKEGRKNTASSFDYGAQLTEFALLGNLAQHVGPGKPLEWDAKKMKVKNMPELSQWISRKPRKGWSV